MVFLAVLAMVGVCSCEGKFNYHADQDNVTLILLPDNDYMTLAGIEDDYPTGIEYLTDIIVDTGLMVRMLFGNDDDRFDPENGTRMNICDVLDKANDDPNSPQAQYKMPESLGLTSTRCPILTGIKVLSLYTFPTNFTSNKIGSGVGYYRMRVETANQDLDDQAIMELRVDLTLTTVTLNATYSENSNSKLSTPSIISSLAIGLIVLQLIN